MMQTFLADEGKACNVNNSNEIRKVSYEVPIWML